MSAYLLADYESEPLEGAPGSITVVIRFESKEALDSWYRSPEYLTIIGLRTENSTGIAVVVVDLDAEEHAPSGGDVTSRGRFNRRGR